MTSPAAKNRIDLIQALRGVAATIVALGHAMSVARKSGYDIPLTLPGGAGVDLFFMISGFIIVYSSERLFGVPGGWKTFMRRRLVRVVPMYWGATALFMMMLAVDAWRGGLFPSVQAILSSFFFVPSDAFKPADGHPYPILAQGWTLNYEMFFYVLFAVCIGMGRARAVATVALSLLVLTIVIALRPSGWLVLDTWGQAIVLEFALGMGIALARRRGVMMPAMLRAALVLLSIVWLAVCRNFPGPGEALYGFDRLLAWGVPCACLLAAAILGPDLVPKALERPVKLFGDASFSYYLFHPIVYVAIQHSHLRVPGPFGAWIYVAGLFVAGALVSLAVHLLIERRILLYLQRDRATPAPAHSGIAKDVAV
jgi:exopolysaccharide production protein ExoZ